MTSDHYSGSLSVDGRTRERVSAAVRDLRDDLVEFAGALVRIESIPGEEGDAQALVRETFERDLDLETTTLSADDVADLEDHPEFWDAGRSYDDRPNVIGRRPGTGGGRSLVFNGHVDVVPAGDETLWDRDPFDGAVEDGVLYGRGASDMKGGVAAMAFAVKALENAGVSLAGDLFLESVIEEEAGGFGGSLVTALDGPTADAVVIPEPTDFDMWVANDGVSYFRVTVEGKGAHAAETDAGVNAISKLIPVYQALEALHDERKTTVHDERFEQWHEHTVSLNLGTLHAGDWASSVPDEAVLEARISHAPSEAREEIREVVEATVAEATAGDPWLEAHPPEVEWFGWRGSSAEIPQDSPIIETVQRVRGEAFDAEAVPKGFPGGIDTRFFVNYADTPAVCFGPGAHGIHGANEHLPVDELLEITESLALVAMEWCGYEVADE